LVNHKEVEICLTPFVESHDGLLAEEGFDGKEVFYLVYDPKIGKTEKNVEIQSDGVVYRPIDNNEVRDRTILMCSATVEYKGEEKLTDEICNYLNRWHEAPDPLSRTLDVAYVFLTYVYDLVPQLPYRRYLAPWGRGKSAWLEALGWICYRGIILAGSDTDKSVVRKLNNWHGTALIDEADFGDSSFYAFLTKILNIGYDRKTGFYHRSDDNDQNKTISYNVFSPKLLATRAKYKDVALESRCLTTIGRENRKAVPLFRMEKFLIEAQDLRNKLILWRFRNYHRIREAVKALEEPKIAEKVYNRAGNVSSRVKQVILPLWLIGGEAMRETLTKLAKTFDERLKIEDPDYLLELQARDAVKTIVSELENPDSENISNMVNVLYQDPPENKQAIYSIPLSLIAKTILEEEGIEKDQITRSDVTSTSKRLKGVFESNLGFKILIGKKRSREVLIPYDWMNIEEKRSTSLNGFIEDDEGSHKDVHQVTDVHRNNDSEELGGKI
jgi:hypothetical protein